MKKATLQEFLVPNRTLVLKSKNGKVTKSYKLAKFTVEFYGFLYYNFATRDNPDGVVNVSNRLSNNDKIIACELIYFLLEDKTDFPTFEDFTKALDTYKESLSEMLILITQIIKESLPSYNKKKIGFLLLKMTLLIVWTGIIYMI